MDGCRHWGLTVGAFVASAALMLAPAALGQSASVKGYGGGGGGTQSDVGGCDGDVVAKGCPVVIGAANNQSGDGNEDQELVGNTAGGSAGPGTPTGGGASADTGTGSLPFTGLDLGLMAAGAFLLVGLGVALGTASRRSRPQT